MALIYLASPYSHNDPAIMQQRADQVAEMAAYLMQAGLHVFAPIPHGVALAKYGLPTDYEGFWKPYCHDTLGRCDMLVVLTLDGWETSTGVQDEIALADDLGTYTEYMPYMDKSSALIVANGLNMAAKINVRGEHSAASKVARAAKAKGHGRP